MIILDLRLSDRQDRKHPTTKPVNICVDFLNKGKNKITELRTILQRESQNS